MSHNGSRPDVHNILEDKQRGIHTELANKSSNSGQLHPRLVDMRKQHEKDEVQSSCKSSDDVVKLKEDFGKVRTLI